jgi:hypothetical protein
VRQSITDVIEDDNARLPDLLAFVADFHGNDHRFQLKAINDFILGDHHRSEATLAF